MSRKKREIDWSEPYFRDMLVYQRRYLWHEDTLDKLAEWIGLESGMTLADIGCGLGYLGYSYWPYFGRGGRYIGVDRSPKLLHDSARAAHDWASDGVTRFVTGSAYDIPLDDGLADVVMCQTLMIHLREPERALAEMIRITKPGGTVVCKEGDNLRAELNRAESSLPRFSKEDEAFLRYINLTAYRGRLKLGLGDWGAGTKIPRMMNRLGLVNLDVRVNDRVFFLHPPYDTPRQKHYLDIVKKHLVNEKEVATRQKEQREHFLAGGGTPEEYDRAIEKTEEYLKEFRRQVEAGEFYVVGGAFFYVTKGTKSYS